MKFQDYRELPEREKTVLIAQSVMGWDVTKHFAWDGDESGWWNDLTQEHFNPVSKIGAAWQVVEKMRAEDFWADLVQINKTEFCAIFYNLDDSYEAIFDIGREPEAICEAALLALGAVEVEA